MGLINKLDRFTRKNWLPRLNGDRAYIEHVNTVIDKVNEIIDEDSSDNASLSGDNTFTGNNVFDNPVEVGAPLGDSDATTKDYVDTAIAAVKPYASYVALLTQTYVSSTSGLLVAGKTYQIDTLVAGDDFANVGYVAPSTPFIATGTTPTNWTNSTEVINTTDSAPVAVELENTLGEVPTFTYFSAGAYSLNISAASFLATKTMVLIGAERAVSDAFMQGFRVSDNEIDFETINNAGANTDGIFSNTSIEIRVYY